MLQDDRTNLNASWYRASRDQQPDLNYDTIIIDQNGIHTTANGWPSESYIEFREGIRLLAEFGQVDPQMRDYNFSGDSPYIFPADYIQDIVSVDYSATNQITQGCFFDPNSTSLVSINNSWALSSDLRILPPSSANQNITLESISNLTACGITPLLNQTLQNETADENALLYQTIAYSSIWSWATGEPRLIDPKADDADLLRCAVLDTAMSGRWLVDDCTNRYPAACRIASRPFEWIISDNTGTYSDGQENCHGNSSFGVPRTGLENRYLVQAASQYMSDNPRSDTTRFWVNFNSLDLESCWVVGVNATCPYQEDDAADLTRTVVVPTVAAVIIFVLAVLTFFVKCAANRQNSRRRRRRKMDDGWDYEGVPS